MPIKPENRKLYPPNWPEISRRIRLGRANNHCEVCGVKNYSVGYRVKGAFTCLAAPPFDLLPGYTQFMAAIDVQWHFTASDLTAKIIVIVLTVGHLDHNPANCDDNNLLCMCQHCHNIYDRPHRNETMRLTRMAGQLIFQFALNEN